jgi:predicted nuclease with TOPRIM domain
MTDDRYNSLKKKYDELLEENELLREEILKFESQQNTTTGLKVSCLSEKIGNTCNH